MIKLEAHFFSEFQGVRSGELWGALGSSGELWGALWGALRRSGELWGALGSSGELWELWGPQKRHAKETGRVHKIMKRAPNKVRSIEKTL